MYKFRTLLLCLKNQSGIRRLFIQNLVYRELFEIASKHMIFFTNLLVVMDSCIFPRKRNLQINAKQLIKCSHKTQSLYKQLDIPAKKQHSYSSQIKSIKNTILV